MKSKNLVKQAARPSPLQADGVLAGGHQGVLLGKESASADTDLFSIPAASRGALDLVKTSSAVTFLLLIPGVVFAAGGALEVFIGNLVKSIIQPIILLLFALALYYFVSGVMGFVLKADDPKARDTGRRKLVWGVLGFFIMMSVVTILSIVTNTFCGTAFCSNIPVGGPR